MEITKTELTGWYNKEFGGEVTLRVEGDVDVGRNDVGAVLVFDSKLESDPPHLALRIIPTTILIPRQEGENSVGLSYCELAEVGAYASIRILFADSEVQRIDAKDIQEVS